VFLVAGIAYIAGRDALAGAAIIAAGAALIMAGVTLIATNTALKSVGDASAYVLTFMAGVLLILEGPSLIFSSRIRPEAELNAETARDRSRRSRQRISPAIAATLAVMVAVTVSGSAPAGSQHVAELKALTWVAFIAVFAAMGANLVTVIGPRTIAGRTRHAIDWAIKGPQATQEPGPAPPPVGDTR
jgi:hypothetical protein